MAYTLQGFIAKKSTHNKLTDCYQNATAVDIGHELFLIPFTTELFEEINKLKVSKPIGKFHYLTENIEIELLKHFDNMKIAYIEADYFGGQGNQIAVIWKDKKRIYLSNFGDNEINKVLEDFGIIADFPKDEFDTVSLGRNRHTECWLENEK